MTAIVTTIAQGVTAETFLASAASGQVRFYRVRANGTTRHIPFLADGTKDREIAEWVQEQREEGRTMKAIASEALMSVPTVRRLLNSLLLTEEVESYDEEDIEDLLAEAAAVAGEPVVEAQEEQPVAVVAAASESEEAAAAAATVATEAAPQAD